ncbi:MAG: hypothetical protein K2N33_00985 [Clostridia bacterium]|nr:hypothetical protein [Clostridia bacterium]
MTDIEKMANMLHKLILKACKHTELLKRPQEITHISAELKFKREEVMQMPKGFRKMFRSCGSIAHVLKYFEDNETYYYEIRFLRNGYNVVVLSRDLVEAKQFFILEVNKL